MDKHKVVERVNQQVAALSFHEHLQRYEFAKQYLQPGWTLDIASGTGYGSDLIAKHPNIKVVGMDTDESSLLTSRRQYTSFNIFFVLGSGVTLPFQNKSVENVVTLETLEHITDDRGFLSELSRVMTDDGICILSTPNREHSLRHSRVNPYHIREYAEVELKEILRQYFINVTVFYQGLSSRYQSEVRTYTGSIQENKRKLTPALRFVINKVYRPMKQFVPTPMTNLFIKNLLGAKYPQPDLADMQISEQPFEDTSDFIVLCQKSIRS